MDGTHSLWGPYRLLKRGRRYVAVSKSSIGITLSAAGSAKNTGSRSTGCALRAYLLAFFLEHGFGQHEALDKKRHALEVSGAEQ